MAARISPKSGKDKSLPREKSQPLSMAMIVADLQSQRGEAILCLLTLFLYAVGAGYEGDALTVINTAGPLIFSFGLLWGIIGLLRRSVNNLWVPLFWYRVSMLIYFGVGALVPLYANEAARDLIRNFYDFYPTDMLRLNLLLTTFHMLMIFFSTILMSVVANIAGDRNAAAGTMISTSSISLGMCGAIFLVVGDSVNFLVILPSTLGLYDMTVLGQLLNLSLASLLGYFMLTLWALQNKKSGWLALIIAVAALETMLGLLQMTKFIALFPSVMIGLGFVFHKPTLRRLGVFAGTMMLVFMTLAPVIGYARNSAQAAYAGNATPIEALSIYISYFSDNTIVDVDRDSQDGWARLSYVNAGTFAMNRYDDGDPGSTLRYAPIIWVPRLLYPDKPFITDVAREFTYAINGNYNSSTSPGIPAEAYWNMGWTGVLIISAVMAFVFTLWSFYTYIAIEREAWHLFFIVLLGMRTASRLDGMFVADVMGPIGLAILAHVIIELLNRFLPERLAKVFGRKAKPRPQKRGAMLPVRYSPPQS